MSHFRLKSQIIPESAIEEHILVFLWRKGILAWKNVTAGYYDAKLKKFKKQRSQFAINGTSDILGIIDGRFLAIEVKSAKGYPTDDQKRFIEKVNANGGIAFVARSLEEVEAKLFPKDGAI